MTDEPLVVDPPVDPPADPPDEGGVSLTELEEMVGRVVTEKLSGVDFVGSLKDDILTEVKSLFETGKGDSDGLLAKIGEMIDAKLAGKPAPTNGNGEGRKPKLRIFS